MTPEMSPPLSDWKVSNMLLGKSITNSSKKTEMAGPKWKQHLRMDTVKDRNNKNLTETEETKKR